MRRLALAVLLLRALTVLALLLVTKSIYAFDAKNLDRFEVIGVENGNTIRLDWRKRPSADSYPKQPSIRLVGIWSMPDHEPPSYYARRLEFLRALQGSTVQARTITETHFAPGSEHFYSIFVSPESPAEVFLENGASLNELLLRNGLAMLDEGPLNGLSLAEFTRYKAAETEARTRTIGIWASDSHAYLEAKERMQNDQITKARQKADWRGALVLQIVLLLSILALLYLHANNPIAQKATLSLLVIPLGFLLAMFGGTDPLTARTNPQLAGRSAVAILFFFGLAIFNFVRLVVKGPGELWGVVWIGVRRSRSIFLFFAGLWTLIILFAAVYRFGGIETWGPALKYSSSIMFGLPAADLSQNKWFNLSISTISLVEKVALIMWLGLCAARIRPDSSFPVETRKWNVAVAVASMVTVNISVVSCFAICFLLGFEIAGLEDLTRSDAFWFSVATLFRQSHHIMAPDSLWIRLFQIIEVHVGMFLGLVGFRVIYALATGRNNSLVTE